MRSEWNNRAPLKTPILRDSGFITRSFTISKLVVKKSESLVLGVFRGALKSSGYVPQLSEGWLAGCSIFLPTNGTNGYLA
jgi:hypothetical protein